MIRRVIHPIILIVCFSGNLFAGGITVGLVSGLNPDLLKFNQSVSETQLRLGNFVASDNAGNAGNSSVDKSSASIIGIPVGLNVRYLDKFFIVKLAFLNHFSIGGTNQVTTGNNSSLKKTAVEQYQIRSLEIPLTFAFNIRNDAFTRFYAGAGPSLFYGSVKILHDNGTKLLLADEDIYSGWAFGGHLLIGGEVALTRKFSLSLELAFNFANLAPVKDEAITSATTTKVQQDEQADNPEILGFYDPQKDTKITRFDPQLPQGLNFTGFQIMLSLNYFVGIL